MHVYVCVSVGELEVLQNLTHASMHHCAVWCYVCLWYLLQRDSPGAGWNLSINAHNRLRVSFSFEMESLQVVSCVLRAFCQHPADMTDMFLCVFSLSRSLCVSV